MAKPNLGTYLDSFGVETHELIATCDPQFVDYGMEEIQDVAPGADALNEVAPGVLRVIHGLPFEAFAATWTAAPPVFVRHICPVHVTAPLVGTDADLATLAQYAGMELAPLLVADMPFSVQTRLLTEVAYRPLAVNDAVATIVQDMVGAPLDVRAPQQVVSVVVIQNAEGQIEALLGVSTVVQNLSDWAGGVRRFAREEGQISRSEFKLLEALDVFGIELLPRSTALDLGASPGGWTRVLRAKELYVTAVDPGEMDPRLKTDRGIRYKPMTAESYLRNDPDTFDLIVNDMRMDARDSARLIAQFAPYLYPHGVVIMTLKLPQQHGKRVLDHALEILHATYTVAGVRQLFHNRSEVTVILHKRGRA
ncbi:MAG: SAM-dependent methyltransferase [Litorilinea sp.]